MAKRVAPLLAALLLAGVASTVALGGSRNVKQHNAASWSAAVRGGSPAGRQFGSLRGKAPPG